MFALTALTNTLVHFTEKLNADKDLEVPKFYLNEMVYSIKI